MPQKRLLQRFGLFPPQPKSQYDSAKVHVRHARVATAILLQCGFCDLIQSLESKKPLFLLRGFFDRPLFSERNAHAVCGNILGIPIVTKGLKGKPLIVPIDEHVSTCAAINTGLSAKAWCF